MLTFAPRCTMPCQVGAAIYSKFLHTEPPVNEDLMASVKSECDAFQALREQIEQEGENVGIDVLVEYLTCVRSVLLKLDLQSHTFTWRNSIGFSRAPVQGVGLAFECLNLLFNIASHYIREGALLYEQQNWTAAKLSFQMAGGALFQARETESLKLIHNPPLELQDSTLAILYGVSLVQAMECGFKMSDDPSDAWAIHLRYARLAESSQTHTLMKIWHQDLDRNAQHYGSLAYLKLSYAYMNSRKNSDRVVAHTALVRALDLATTDDIRREIRRIISEPRGRQGKTLEDAPSEELNECDYFESVTPVRPVEFASPRPKNVMFSRLLPLSIAAGPLILKEKLKDYVQKEIAGQLYRINLYTRSVMVKWILPCSLELAYMPDQVPPTLLIIASRVRNSGGIKVLRDQLELSAHEARHCHSMLTSLKGLHDDKDKLVALQRCAVSGINSLKAIKDKFNCSAHLIELLDKGERHIAEFLGIPADANLAATHKIIPPFLRRADSFYKQLLDRILARSEKCLELSARAREYDFFRPVMELVESREAPEQWSLKDLSSCYEAALAEFEADRLAVQAEKKQAEDDVQAQMRFYSESRKLLKAASTAADREMLRSVKSLMLAAVQFYDMSYNLIESHRFFNALNTAVANLKARSENPQVSVSPAEDAISRVVSATDYNWRPGMAIHIS